MNFTQIPNVSSNICTAVILKWTAREIKMILATNTCHTKTCKYDHRKEKFRNIHIHRFPKEKTLILKWEKACGKSFLITIWLLIQITVATWQHMVSVTYGFLLAVRNVCAKRWRKSTEFTMGPFTMGGTKTKLWYFNQRNRLNRTVSWRGNNDREFVSHRRI